MRILHINEAQSWRGGESQTLLLIQELSKLGFDNVLAAHPNGDLYGKAKQAGIQVFPFKLGSEINPFALSKINILFKKANADIIHAHTAHAAMAGAWVRSRNSQSRYVLTRRVEFPLKRNFITRWKYAQMPDKVIAISQGVKSALMQSGIQQDRISVVYSGIPDRSVPKAGIREKLRDEFGFSEVDTVVGMVAAFTPDKAHDILMKAAKQIQSGNTKFLLIGDGRLMDDTRSECRRNGLEGCIVFAGFREDVQDILAAMDIFVLPSRSEGLGTSILDAMQAGLPVVATKTGGIPELVDDGKTGYLVDVDNSVLLAQKLTAVIEDSQLQKSMRTAAIDRAKLFSIESTAQGTAQVYESVAK